MGENTRAEVQKSPPCHNSFERTNKPKEGEKNARNNARVTWKAEGEEKKQTATALISVIPSMKLHRLVRAVEWAGRGEWNAKRELFTRCVGNCDSGISSSCERPRLIYASDTEKSPRDYLIVSVASPRALLISTCLWLAIARRFSKRWTL